ncbi:hypothetical protein [Geothrix sp. 21YS21S-2]|uniref:hypothetical protein n=1 Tax=Geothrix sp. 21YS21S-2 TaxID=3068893 RepID=UPI0027BAFA85|nr:hypothetical protein [Geothrix sp. 21YS21S-2]
MQKLTSAQFKQKSQIQASLSEVTDEIRKEVEAINSYLEAASERMENLVERHNGLVGEANSFIESVHEGQEAYYESRSENWQDGDKGGIYQDWMDAWAEELEAIGVEVPEQMDEPDLFASDTFTDLPPLP